MANSVWAHEGAAGSAPVDEQVAECERDHCNPWHRLWEIVKVRHHPTIGHHRATLNGLNFYNYTHIFWERWE